MAEVDKATDLAELLDNIALDDQTGLDRAEKRKRKHYEKQKEKRKLQRASAQKAESGDSGDSQSPTSDWMPSHLYEVEISRGKGTGLFATKAICRGELVLVEKPLFLVPRTQSIEKTLDTIKNLPSHKLEQFTHLADNMDRCCCCSDLRRTSNIVACCESHHASNTYARFLHSIWMINTFACPLDQRGIYVTAGKVNHSCTPNLIFSHRSDKATMLAHAVRDVAAGEELTWSYVDVCQSSQFRRLQLERLCSDMANCACDTCSEVTFTDIQRKRLSDERRARISELRVLLFDLYPRQERLNREDVLRSGLEMERLLKEERLEGMQLAACYSLMALARASQSATMGVGYKKKELQVLRTCFGSDSPRVKGCEAEVADLEAGRIPVGDRQADAQRRADANFSF